MTPPPSLGKILASMPGSTPGSARGSIILGGNISNLLSARKDLSITPSTKMKQLQWDKIPQQQVQKTVFNDDSTQDEDWLRKLQLDGVWVEMEEGFKARQPVIDYMGWLFLSFQVLLHSS
jgi:cytokinesis protein